MKELKFGKRCPNRCGYALVTQYCYNCKDCYEVNENKRIVICNYNI